MDEVICGASDVYVVLQPIHLGTGAQGAKRRKALESLAKEAGYTWGGKPSVGRWLVALADEKTKLEKEFDSAQ